MTRSIFDISIESLDWSTLSEFIDLSVPEGPRVDYKMPTNRVAESIVGMANNLGGVIILGVGETPDKRPVVPIAGVDATFVQGGQLENWCHAYIEPPYVPPHKAIPIPSTDRFVVVVRVDPVHAPRPLYHREKGTLVRLWEENRPANPGAFKALLDEVQNAGGLGQRVAASYFHQSHGPHQVISVEAIGQYANASRQSRVISDSDVEAAVAAVSRAAQRHQFLQPIPEPFIGPYGLFFIWGLPENVAPWWVRYERRVSFSGDGHIEYIGGLGSEPLPSLSTALRELAAAWTLMVDNESLLQGYESSRPSRLGLGITAGQDSTRDVPLLDTSEFFVLRGRSASAMTNAGHSLEVTSRTTWQEAIGGLFRMAFRVWGDPSADAHATGVAASVPALRLFG